MVGTRGAETAKAFIDDLASRLANRVQPNTDGHRLYLQAVEGAFGSAIDYAMLVSSTTLSVVVLQQPTLTFQTFSK
jgi:hypothetical protein